jgi:hypothetical protein
MAEFVVFGDAEAAVTDILRASTPLNAIGQIHVSTDLIGWVRGQRIVRVTRSGGTPSLWMRLDNPRITVDTVAEDKAIAHDMAAAARGAIFAAMGDYAGHGLLLCDVTDVGGLAWLPDDREPDIARYVFSVALTTRPA